MAKNKNEEFDKDYLFDLIMPSVKSAGTTDNLAEEFLPQNPAQALPAEPTLPPPSPQEPQKQEETSAESNQISSLKQKLLNRPPVEISKSAAQDLMIINVMEPLVMDKLDAAFEKFKCCKCDKCRKDVAVLALNNLQPDYCMVENDKLNSLLAQKDSKEVSIAVIKAILYVKSNPQH